MTEAPVTARKSEESASLPLLVWLLLIAGLVVAFAHTFAEMWVRWFPRWQHAELGLYERITGGQSYYTHGPLVPLVSLLIGILLFRHTRIRVRPKRAAGLAVLILAILLHLVGCLARVNFVSGFAMIGVVMGLILLIWGAEALRRLWFPVALLLFMVPLPEVTIANFNFNLKMLAASWGVSLANMLSIAAERVGNRVLLDGDKSMIIANVCNGLRTLISLLAFGALYAYACQLRGLWRLGLFAASLGVALVSNTIRIVSLIVVADIWSVEAAVGWYHDTSGLMVFVLALMMMFGLERLVLWARKAVGRPAVITPLFADVRRTRAQDTQASQLWRAAASPRGWVAVALIAAAAGGAMWMNRSIPPYWNETTAKAALPDRLDVGGTLMYSHDIPLDQQTKDILETGDCLNRVYLAPGKADMGFCIIFSRDNRKGTHPPDLCLAGAGEGIMAQNDLLATSADGGRKIPCRELIVQAGRQKQYFLYTYKCGGSYTNSFWRQQFTIFRNGLLDQDSSGALIRVSTNVDTTVEDARARATRLLGVAIPHLDERLK
jgi:EpsI family protein